MAIKIRSNVFQLKGHTLDARALDGSCLRCVAGRDDDVRYFEYDISTGALHRITSYENGVAVKHKAVDEDFEVEAQIEVQMERQYEVGFGGDYSSGSEASTVSNEDVFKQLELGRWLTSGMFTKETRDTVKWDYSDVRDVDHIIKALTDSRVDAKQVIQELNLLNNDLKWKDIISIRWNSDGFQLNNTLEFHIKDALFYEDETSQESETTLK